MYTKAFLLLLLMLGLVGAGCAKNTTPVLIQSNTMENTAMTIQSSAFDNGGMIPEKYGCNGDSSNPPLTFVNVPAEAKSLVLLMDDPDIPRNLKPNGVFDHWVIYNMPGTTQFIEENSTPPGKQGKNGAGETKYAAPCPPDREHRYFFKLYALDSDLQFEGTPDKATVIKAMEGHIVDQAELMGRYEQKKQ